LQRVGRVTINPWRAPLHRVTEVLTPASAGHAFVVNTRAADSWYDQVTNVEAVDTRPNFHDLGQTLVADYEGIIPARRCAVLKGTDPSVGPTDADLEYAQRDFIRL